MSRSLLNRLRRLEASGAECPECGFDGDWSKAEIVVVWEDEPTKNDTGNTEKRCRTCAHPVHFSLG